MRHIKSVFRDKNNTPALPLPPEDQPGSKATADAPGLSRIKLRSQSGESGKIEAFPDGIKVWHDCPNAVVDICFVHGLTGNRDTTWTAQGQSTPWPQTLLPAQIPARLLTYGYDAYVVRASVVSTNRLLDHATNFLVDLTNDRKSNDASARPLIFVAHSLGGLVCKQAILMSRNHHEAHLHDVFDHVIGVAFMGTPHKGSWMADWARFPASVFGLVRSNTNKKLLATLETDNQFLEPIQTSFLSLVRDLREHGRSLDVTCFFEELPLTIAGVVVSKESATLDGYTAISIHANHRDMVRFSDGDTGFRRLLGELKRWTQLQIPIPESQPENNAASAPVIPNLEEELARKASYYIPFPRNKRFVGREIILKRLQDMFFAEDCQKAALIGLGGIGKTQVALQLGYWVKEHRPEFSIFWIPALSIAAFDKAYAEIARRLELPGSNKNDNDDPKDMVREYLSSAAAGPWLIIVDNADDGDVLFAPGGLSEYLPESESGLTLYTTRSREVAVETAGSDVVYLSEMGWDEATSFLEKSLIRKDLVSGSDPAVKDLLEEISYLPLAITQAAAYLNKNQISVAEYLRLLRGAELNMVSLLNREFRDSTRYAGSHNSVAATWLVSFEQILKLDSFAGQILSFISQIEPKAIPESILPKAEVEEHTTSAIGLLCGYAFLTRRGDTGIFDMHSLVHVAITLWLGKNQRMQEAQDTSIKHLAAIFPSDHKSKDPLWRSYLPHTLRAIKGIHTCETMDIYRLFWGIGCCLYRDSRSREAIPYLEEACRWIEEDLDEEDQNRLRVEKVLAAAYTNTNQEKEALVILKRLVSIWAKIVPEDNPDRLATEYDLAAAYVADGQFDEALRLLDHVVTVANKCLLEDNAVLLASKNELARVYFHNGRFKDIIELLEDVVAIDTTRLPEDEDSRLASTTLLGRAYVKDGQVERGVMLLERVVNVRKSTLQGDHVDLLAAQQNLANAYGIAGKAGTEIAMLEHVVDVLEKTLTSDDDDLLSAQKRLARAYENAGLAGKSLELLEHAVAMRDGTLPEGHPARLASHVELGFAYVDCGQLDKAVKLFEREVSVEVRTLQDDDPKRLAPMAHLAYIYYINGQPEKAIELFEALAPLQEKAFREDSEARLVAQHNLACAYENVGRFGEAKEVLEKVIAIEARTLPRGERSLSVSQVALARILQKEKEDQGVFPAEEQT